MNDDELEQLLRSRPTPLPAPDGRWEVVRRRARRRRIAKLSAAMLATVVVAVGIGFGPMVLSRHHSASEQRVSIAAAPSASALRTSARPAPASPTEASSPSSLRGFEPSSVSFVSQNDGFLLGSGPGAGSVLAHTLDGGSNWTRLADIAIPAKTAGVRFATADIGYAFGLGYLVTSDGGRSWRAESSPGYISDLETMDGHVYALVSACVRCRQFSLYAASTTAPALRKVTQVPDLVGDSVSLAVHDNAAYVLDTSKGSSGQVWSTLDGTRWAPRPSPCGTTMGLITEWSASGVAAACDVHLYNVGKESKRVYVSTDGAASWTPLPTPPTRFGYINSVSASGPENVVVGDDASGLDVTTDGGRHWSLRGPSMSDGAQFVGFISLTRIVALPAVAADQLFTRSDDAGLLWSTKRFAP